MSSLFHLYDSCHVPALLLAGFHAIFSRQQLLVVTAAGCCCQEPFNYQSISSLAFLVLRSVWQSYGGIFVILSFPRRLGGLHVQPEGPRGPGECVLLSGGWFGQ